MEETPADALELYVQGMKPSRWETEEADERNYIEDHDVKGLFIQSHRGAKSRNMSESPHGKHGKKSSVKGKSHHDKKKKKKKKDSKEKDSKEKKKQSTKEKKKKGSQPPSEEGLEVKSSSDIVEAEAVVEKEVEKAPVLKTKEPTSWSEFHSEKYSIDNFRELRDYWESIKKQEEEEKERERAKQRLEEEKSKKHSKKQLRPPTPPPPVTVPDLQEKKSLFDSPREIRNTVRVERENGEEFYVPSWMVKTTTCDPVITFSYNPKVVEPPKFMNREEMLKSLPLEILQLINDFFISTTDRGTA